MARGAPLFHSGKCKSCAATPHRGGNHSNQQCPHLSHICTKRCGPLNMPRALDFMGKSWKVPSSNFQFSAQGPFCHNAQATAQHYLDEYSSHVMKLQLALRDSVDLCHSVARGVRANRDWKLHPQCNHHKIPSERRQATGRLDQNSGIMSHVLGPLG